MILISSSILIIVLFISFAYSSGMTGNFYKAFSKTLSPNEIIEQNITVRKYYNLTIRFRYSVNGSDLSFSDADGSIILKNDTDEIGRTTGITDGKIYLMKDKLQIDSIKYVDVLNVEKYNDINNQNVNITFYGTKAYLTIIVSKRQGNATLQGYLIDDLTSQSLDDVIVLAFEKDSDPYTSIPVTQVTSENGMYSLNLQTDSEGKGYDIYVKDYQVS